MMRSIRLKAEKEEKKMKLQTRKKVIEILKQNNKPVSKSELARQAGLSWVTLDRAILSLALEGKVRIHNFNTQFSAVELVE